jgi:hypothetical protein
MIVVDSNILAYLYLLCKYTAGSGLVSGSRSGEVSRLDHSSYQFIEKNSMTSNHNTAEKPTIESNSHRHRTEKAFTSVKVISSLIHFSRCQNRK